MSSDPPKFSFGTPAASGTPTSGTTTSALFGSAKPATGGLFGGASTGGGFSFGNASSTTPASSAPATGGLFGGAAASSTPGSGFSFGQPASSTPAATTAQAKPSLFGGASVGNASGGGLFGAPAAAGSTTPAPAKTGFNFGSSTTPVNTPPANGAQAPSLFGSLNAQASQNTTAPKLSFGTPAGDSSQPKQGLFGGLGQANNTSSTGATPAGGLFGAKPAAPAAATGGLFGSAPTASTAPASGGLFGSTPAASAAPASGGLFGSTPTTNAAPGSTGLFGGGSTLTSASGGSNLFGNLNKPASSTPAATSSTPSFSFPALGGGQQASGSAPTGGFFGSTAPATTQAQPSSALSLTAPSATTPAATSQATTPSAQPAATSNLFGGASKSAAPAGGLSLFGSTPAAPGSGSSLFGQKPTESSSATPASATAPAGGLFGGLNAAKPAAAATTADSATPAATAGGLFGGLSAAKSTAESAATSATATTSSAPASSLFGGATSTTAPAASATAATTATQPTALASSTTGPLPPASSRLKNKSLDDILTRWASDLSKYKSQFQKQAEQVARWDRLLVENTDKISKLYTKAFQAERDAGEVERQLAVVEGQQDELEQWLDSYEVTVNDMLKRSGLDGEQGAMGVDADRERTYSMAERLTSRLDEVNRDLEDIITEVNSVSASLSRTKGPDDPLSNIVRVLNSHLTQLQTIDSNTSALQTRIAAAKKEQSSLRGSSSANGWHGGGLGSDATEDFYRSYRSRR